VKKQEYQVIGTIHVPWLRNFRYTQGVKTSSTLKFIIK